MLIIEASCQLLVTSWQFAVGSWQKESYILFALAEAGKL
jgi:hypothetical protein